MTNEERRETTELALSYAEKAFDGDSITAATMRGIIAEAYTAGRKSLRAEMKQDMPAWEIRVRLNQALSKHEELYNDRGKAWDDLLAERQRSAKLVAVLQNIRDDGYAENYITRALQEYEASL